MGQPAWPVCLVIASRGLPPLSTVARLRVEGRLLELDENDLRFTPEEIRAALSDSGLALGDEQLHQIAARTAGWPAQRSLPVLPLL